MSVEIRVGRLHRQGLNWLWDYFRRQTDTQIYNNNRLIWIHTRLDGKLETDAQIKRKLIGNRTPKKLHYRHWVLSDSDQHFSSLELINHWNGELITILNGSDLFSSEPARLTAHRRELSTDFGKIYFQYIFTHWITLKRNERCSPYYCLFILGKTLRFSHIHNSVCGARRHSGSRYIGCTRSQEEQINTDSPAETRTLGGDNEKAGPERSQRFSLESIQCSFKTFPFPWIFLLQLDSLPLWILLFYHCVKGNKSIGEEFSS